MKTNSIDMPITMQRKLDYTRQAMVKYQQSESTVTNSCSVIRIRQEDTMKPNSKQSTHSEDNQIMQAGNDFTKTNCKLKGKEG